MHLTLAKAHELINAAVSEKGADYVYPAASPAGSGICTYVDYVYDPETGQGTPIKGCIIGHAFLGAFPEVNMNELGEAFVNEEGVDEFVEFLMTNGYICDYDQDAADYLNRVQVSQDAARPWGEANEAAKQGLGWSKTQGRYTVHVHA